jgi:hypothetical protein
MIGRLNTAQRVVLVVAWGLTLAVVASVVATEHRTGDWFNYAPTTSTYSDGAVGPGTARWVITWLVAIVLWAVGALRLLRTDRPPDPT